MAYPVQNTIIVITTKNKQIELDTLNFYSTIKSLP